MPDSLDNLEFKVNEEWEKFSEENSWVTFIPEFVEDENGQNYMRKRGGSVVYKIIAEDEQGRQTYRCAQCDSDILEAKVAHPIHDGPFPLSGSGQCHYENVPYCPNCEEEPNFNGFPITVPYNK